MYFVTVNKQEHIRCNLCCWISKWLMLKMFTHDCLLFPTSERSSLLRFLGKFSNFHADFVEIPPISLNSYTYTFTTSADDKVGTMTTFVFHGVALIPFDHAGSPISIYSASHGTGQILTCLICHACGSEISKHFSAWCVIKVKDNGTYECNIRSQLYVVLFT